MSTGINMFKVTLIIVLIWLSAVGSIAHAVFDQYPDDVAENLKQAAATEESARKKLDGHDAQYLMSTQFWQAGTPLMIAFKGGTPASNAAIVQVASEWLNDENKVKSVNLEFNFGRDKKSGQYRQWSPEDKTSSAHIRISFEGDRSYSRIGRDAINAPLNQATMYLGGFDRLPGNFLSAHDRAVILHEFGHALGMYHEHQREECRNGYRWDSGPKDELSVYEIFKRNYPEAGGTATVNLNLFPIDGVIYASPGFDKYSIMTYALPAQAFLTGEKSTCYVDQERLTLSSQDRYAARAAYPFNPTEGFALLSASHTGSQTAIDAVKHLLPGPELAALKVRVKTYVEAHKPLVYIQYQRRSNRLQALKIRQASQDAGFYAPEIEDVAGKGLKSASVPQIRYFREINAEYATLVAKTLLNLGYKNVRIDRIPSFANRVTRNLIEIWLP